MIDNGNVSAPYVGFNSFAADVQSIVQAWTDPPPAPPSPSGPTLSQGADTGSHAVTVSGNGLTQVTMRFSGAVPSLAFSFGAPGNAGTFDVGNIVAHFWFGTKANASVTVAGPVTSGNTITVTLNGFSVGYTVVSGDTIATAVAKLVANINGGTNPNVGPGATGAAVYAWVNPSNSSQILIAAAAPGVGAAGATPPAGNTGNFITIATLVQSGSASPPSETATPAGAGAPTCTANGAGTAVTCTGTTFAGGTAAVTPTGFSSWSIELVGNGSSAGPGSPAATYDVRLPCTATAAGNSLNRFVCGPLPAYGAASNLAPTAGNPGAGTYNVPVNAVFPGAAGAFTPISPTMYVVLNSSSATNPATVANPQIDYIYAIQ
jgi:hypothetical protein